MQANFRAVVSRRFSVRMAARASSSPPEAKRAKSAKRVVFGPLDCPACSQPLYKSFSFVRHVNHCCPDLLEAAAPPPEDARDSAKAWEDWVARARDVERGMHDQVLDIAFRRQDADGNYLRQGPREILEEMRQLRTEERAKRLLKAAGKAIPMPADHDPIEIIHEDDLLLCLNKPKFVITAPKHRYEGGSMVNRVLGNTGKLPFVVHRLDMNTSGVLLFAKSSKAASLMHEQFRNKTTRKTYLALVLGVPDWDRGTYTTVEAPIGQSPIEKVARAVVTGADGVAGAKDAATEFRVLASSQSAVDFGPEFQAAKCMDPATKLLFHRGEINHAALVECRPLTGRTHQIRVHLAHAGFPIIGDDLYGVTGPAIDRHALHAASIVFRHPAEEVGDGGASFCVKAPLPDDMRVALSALDVDIATVQI